MAVKRSANAAKKITTGILDNIPPRDVLYDSAEKVLALREESASTVKATTGGGSVWVPTFAQTVDAAIDLKREKKRFFEQVMEKDLHYGVIPGTGSKPTLLKPGAEMLLSAMGLNEALTDVSVTVDLTGKLYGEPYIFYRRQCTIYRQLGPRVDERMIVAQAEGSCCNWEVKYRYRNDRLKCPECGQPTITKAKDFSGQNIDKGWICWKKPGKSDGCGAAFGPGDGRIAGQVTGKIINPDPADVANTILKMADKRALVAATLLATGCSDIFTQDVEDFAQDYEPPAAANDVAKPVATPNPAVAQRPSEAVNRSKAAETRNRYIGRITELETALELDAAARSTIYMKYGVFDKSEMTGDKLKEYGAWLNEQMAEMNQYRADLAAAQAEQSAADYTPE